MTRADNDYQEALRRVAQARAEGADLLDLGDLRLENLDFLSDLPDIRVLALGKLRPVRGEHGTEWEYNGSRPSQGFNDLTLLQKLHNLATLDCSSTQVSDLAPLQSLHNLATLSCWSTQVSDLAPLQNLHNLTKLHCIGTLVSDLAPLQNLHNLTTLMCGNTQVSDLTPLQNLHNLACLNCTSTQVSDLAPLRNLHNLATLICGATHVSDLSPLQNLRNLATLLCGSTRVSDLSPLQDLQNLRSLYCEGSLVTRFPDWALRHPTLQVLCLWNNRIRGCDPAILEEFNCLPAARSHFADREFDPREDRELKLILLGNGRVGKTSLRKRLIHDTFDGKELSTHGIQLEEWDIELASGAARLNVWDFGGQDIYHGTHALFLKSRAIFVIVWDRITEKTPSYTEGELTFENYPLQYWLDYVRTVSPGAPILVVENKCDGGAGSQPSADLGELANVHFSARSEAPTEREKLLVHIKTICEAELEDRDAWRIGGGRLAVKEKLLARRRAGEKLLSRYEFEQFCAAEGERISSSEELLKYLHNTGVVYHDATLFHDQIILDQRWAVDAIYTIYHRSRCVNQLRKAQGRFRRGDLHDLAWEDGRFPESVQQLFLGFMQSCSICFRIGEHHDDPEYVAPEFLPERAAVERDIDLRLRTVKTAEAMHFRYHHRFLHPGLMRRFLVRVGALYGDDALYWRNGVILDARKDQAVAEVVCRPRKDGHPSAGEIEIRTLGPGRMRLLARLRNELEKLHDAGTQVQQFASVDGKEWIDVAKLVDFRDLGACLSLTRTKVDLAPFLDLLHRDPDDLLEAQIPDAVPLPEEPARRVYVSYAWGDATPAGKLREAAMQEQCAILRGKAYEVVIDKEATRPGDLISKFIEEIGQGDRVLIVLSDKYLRSVHCMQELHWVYLTSLRKKEVFLKRIYPVVLEDAKIDTWEDRANWAEHWEKEYQKMEAKLRHLGAEGQRLYQSLKSWYADVGDMLAFIADKIRRQGLDGIDADF